MERRIEILQKLFFCLNKVCLKFQIQKYFSLHATRQTSRKKRRFFPLNQYPSIFPFPLPFLSFPPYCTFQPLRQIFHGPPKVTHLYLNLILSFQARPPRIVNTLSLLPYIAINLVLYGWWIPGPIKCLCASQPPNLSKNVPPNQHFCLIRDQSACCTKQMCLQPWLP